MTCIPLTFALLIKRLMKITNVVLVVLSLLPFSVLAQTGILKGTVKDNSSAEEFIGANVYVTNDVTKGSITDVFGNYQLVLPVGTYSISSSYIGYQKTTIENVIIKEGEVTELNVLLIEESISLAGVDIITKRVTNTEMSVIADRKSAFTVKDGISSQEIARSGASNASQAVKQITGASVEDGKYMVVRGLGDRYSITQLNGVTLPSTDPYRNSASLDLIPSFMLDNIMTSKTFSPDQPGNFTGGNMNIKTKSFPEKFFLTFGLSSSYNSISNLKDNFVTVNGGNDFPEYLKDAEARKDLSTSGYILGRSAARRGDLTALQNIDNATTALNSPLMPTHINSGLNNGVSFSVGNQHKLNKKNPFGYVFGIKYKKGYSYYQNGIFNRWQAQKDGMLYKFDMTDTKGTINENMGSFLSMSYQFAKNHEITLSGLYNSDVDEFGREQFGYTEQLGNANYYRARSMGVKERAMQNAQLRGTHELPLLNEAKIEWVIGATKSSQYEPDLRFFSDHIAFENDQVEGNEDVRMDLSSYGLPNHFYRDLNDTKYDFKLDYKQPFGTREGSHVKFGALASLKNRDFSEYRVKVAKAPKPTTDINTDWGGYLGDFGVELTSSFTASNYFVDDTRLSNIYTGHENILGAYGMIVHDFTSKLKVIAGVRVESTDIEVTSADTTLNTGRINKVDPLPSLNLIYSLSDNSNLRFSASQTIARPNMREMAPFFSFDFLGGFLYSGNDSLDRTLIQNFDLRWELFNKPGEMVAVSVYYKNFMNPIVRVFSPISSTGEITFENLDRAVVYGAELEWRKNLNFISESLNNFRVAANLSYIYSEVAIPTKDLESIERNGLQMGDKRPFQGQSPYLANANLYYVNDSANIESSLTFNVFGKRLYEIGATGNPDIYEMPRPLMNFNISKTFADKFDVSLSVGNILGSKFLTQQFYKSDTYEETYTVQQFDLGRTYSIGLSYQIK